MESQKSNLKSQNQSLKPKSDLRNRLYAFSVNVIKFVSLSSRDAVNSIIVNQLVRSSTSIAANVIEAKSSSSRRDFIKFYEIALKSANETKYWLHLLKDTKDPQANDSQIILIIDECNQIANILGSSVLTLKKKNVIDKF